MKNIYLSTLLLGTTILIGCGGGSSGRDYTEVTQRVSSTQIEEEQAEPSTIHKYKVVATPTSGGNCKGADGEMIIQESKVSGTIKTGWGDVLTIDGTFNQSNGDVDGGFAKNRNRLAEYSGSIIDNSGGGTWSDSLGCSGTWKTTKHTSSTPVESSRQSTTSNSNSNNKKVNAHEIQGYQITYPEDGLTTIATFNCDGSYTTATSNHGINIPIDSGNSVQIRDTTSEKVGVLSFSYVQVSLDSQNNVVVGQSKAVDVLDDIHIIQSITKVSECN